MSKNYDTWVDFYNKRKAQGKTDQAILTEWSQTSAERPYDQQQVAPIVNGKAAPFAPKANKSSFGAMSNWVNDFLPDDKKLIKPVNKPTTGGKFRVNFLDKLREAREPKVRNILPVGFSTDLPPSPPTSELESVLAQLNSVSTAGRLNYNDYLGEAGQMAAGAFAPQYQALDMARQSAQTQYNRADPIIEALYNRLQGDLRQGAEQTGQAYGQLTNQRQAQGAGLVDQIAQQYQKSSEGQAELLKSLGIEAAMPALLNDDSANAQAQAANSTQAQLDYLSSTGRNQQDYLGNLVGAAGSQGAASREALLANLARELSGIEQQRLGVASNQSQYAGQLGMDLMRSGQSNANSMIDRIMQSYNLKREADETNYRRGQDAMDRTLQAAEFNAKYGQTGDQGLEWDQMPPLVQGQLQMEELYGDEGRAALNIAVQAASGGYGTDAYKDTGSFIQHVINTAQGEGIMNQFAVLDAIAIVQPLMKLKGTNVL